jgi:hypothetical protein
MYSYNINENKLGIQQYFVLALSLLLLYSWEQRLNGRKGLKGELCFLRKLNFIIYSKGETESESIENSSSYSMTSRTVLIYVS